MGLDAPAVSNMLKGKRGMSIDEAAMIAVYLNVDIHNVLTHSGITVVSATSRRIRVVGYVTAGDQMVLKSENDPGDGIEDVEAPPGFFGSAVIVRGDSFSPRFLDGEILAYRDEPGDPELLLGSEVIAHLTDGRTLLKRLGGGSTPGRYSLISLNPTVPAIVDAPLEWVAKIEWHKPR